VFLIQTDLMGYISQPYYNRIFSNSYRDYFTPQQNYVSYVNISDGVLRQSSIGTSSYHTPIYCDDNYLILNYSTLFLLLDASTLSILATISVTPNAATINNNKVYISVANTIQVRTTTGGLITTISSLTSVYWVEKYGFDVYAAGTNAFWRIGTGDTVTGTIVLVGSARRILIEGNYAYVATSSGWLYEIDLLTFSISRSIQFSQDNYQYGILKIDDNIFLTTLNAEIIRINDFTTRSSYNTYFSPQHFSHNPNNNQIMIHRVNTPTSSAVYNYSTLTQ
jgi:hypothetical protein